MDAEVGLRQPTAGRRRRVYLQWASTVLVPATYFAFSLCRYAPAVTQPGQRLPGGADGILYAWYFEWAKQSLVHLHNPFVSAALNAPAGFNVMWNTSMLALGTLCMPLTATMGPIATVALVMSISPAVSATSAYLVLRRLTGGWVGAALGSAVYGFGPFFIGHSGHLNLIFAPIPPLLVLLGYRLLVTGTRHPLRCGVWLGLLVGAELLVSEEVVVLCAIAATVAVFWLAVLNPREIGPRSRPAALAVVSAAGVSLLIAAVPLAYQFFGPHALPHGVPGNARADLASFVRPSVLQHFATRASVAANRHFPANGAEDTAYLGWPLVVAIGAVALWGLWRRHQFVLWWLLTVGTLAWLSTGSRVSLNRRIVAPGPWAVVHRIPLVGGAQPVRLSLLVTLLVAGLIAWLLARLAGWPLLAAAAVTALVLLPLWPVPRGVSRVPATPRFFTSRAVDEIPAGAVTAVWPQAVYPRIVAMTYQIRSHLRFDLVGGYSVFNVAGVATYMPPLPAFVQVLRTASLTGNVPDPAQLAAARLSVTASGTRYILIIRDVPNADAVVRTAAAVSRCAPHISGDVFVCAVPTPRITSSND